jgi:hypothetical protein
LTWRIWAVICASTRPYRSASTSRTRAASCSSARSAGRARAPGPEPLDGGVQHLLAAADQDDLVAGAYEGLRDGEADTRAGAADDHDSRHLKTPIR